MKMNSKKNICILFWLLKLLEEKKDENIKRSLPSFPVWCGLTHAMVWVVLRKEEVEQPADKSEASRPETVSPEL